MRDAPSRQMNQGDNRLRRRRHHDPSAPGFDPGPGHHGGPGCNGGGRGRGRGRRRGMRAQRGDVRAAVLQLLGEEPMHGYQLMQRITERSEGAWRPSPGTVYPAVSYTHLRAHETRHDLVCRLLLEKKKTDLYHRVLN